MATKTTNKGVRVRVNNSSVPDNSGVKTQKSNAKSSGGVNTPPPTAMYGRMMKKGGMMMKGGMMKMKKK